MNLTLAKNEGDFNFTMYINYSAHNVPRPVCLGEDVLGASPIFMKAPWRGLMHPVSTGLSPWEPGVFTLIVYAVLVAAFIASQLFLASWLGESKPSKEKRTPYECGVIPTGAARFRYPVPFYLVAIFFLIFDVEGAYIFSWAVVYEELGWPGFWQMSFFIVLLLVGLAYIWKQGGLDWRQAYRIE
jgi:NADH-quinone oxidoreductase subunit A